jgi:hypothetical protein
MDDGATGQDADERRETERLGKTSKIPAQN